MYWRLKVSEYGKIGYADIEVAPLTLFVGDNNSGKSYLMSLLWGIQNFGIMQLMVKDTAEQWIEEERILADWIWDYMSKAWEEGSSVAQAGEVAQELQIVLRENIKSNKNIFLRKIFNSWDVKIESLEIELQDLNQISLRFERIKDKTGGMTDTFSFKSSTGNEISVSNMGMEGSGHYTDRILMCIIFSLITGIPLGNKTEDNRNLYLPAARTGFMLTKDLINRAGRNAAFNIVETEQEKMTPFVKPIIQFLDVINDLTYEERGDEKFHWVTEYLEKGMADGTVEMSTLPNKEVSYVPAGQGEAMSLRCVSAVVTELSPLILILKHKAYLNMLFYEEPEICLHPQLQQKIARVICRLVNSQLDMVVTTHSDIILQHINNMLALSGREDREGICQVLNYFPEDLLCTEQVRVYQLKSGEDKKTEVTELPCGPNGFAIPTFNDALDQIMDEAYVIQR
ncbi:MAG: ATP-binding protein [Hungatella sp.]|nr:ATP-binding protein [Hungatella sp.]